MKGLLIASVIVLIHSCYATLVIRGPSEPILHGDIVVLECQYIDSDLNISQVHYEHQSRAPTWVPVLIAVGCFYSVQVEQTADTLRLVIRNAHNFRKLAFRCVSNNANVTAPDNASEPLTFKVHYLESLYLSRVGFSSLFRMPEETKVRLGDEVEVECSAYSSETPKYYWLKEGDDWILPSSTLRLKKASAADGGQYTCVAEHPTVKSLTQKRTISITVLPEDAPWCETSNGRLVLMTSAAAAALLVFIVSMTVFLCRRAKQSKTSKGPIDDRSQKKPIYKTSVESIPSTCADKQPLV